MYDYLSDGTADYTSTELTLAPSAVMQERPYKRQIKHEMDGITPVVISISDDVYFIVPVRWNYLTKSDSGTIFDLWLDSNKANGWKRTFYFVHPTDGHTYVARFWSDLSRVLEYQSPNFRSISEIQLRIEARKAEV